MTKETNLTQALSAKICHDLAGAIGTIDNCIALLDNKNDNIRNQAKELVTEESSNLIHRLRFFRGAYGACEGEDNMSVIAMNKLIKDFLSTTDIKLKTDIQEGVLYVDANLAKSIITLAGVVSDNIVGSGEIMLKMVGNNDNVDIEFTAKSEQLKLNKDSLKIFSNNSHSNVSVKNCREHYISHLLSSMNYEIAVSMDSNSLRYVIQSR